MSARPQATPSTHVETGLLAGSAGAAGCVFSAPSVVTGALGATTLNTVVHRLLPSLIVTLMPEYNLALSIALPVSLRRISRAEAPELVSSGRRSCRLPKPRVDQVLSCDGVSPLLTQANVLRIQRLHLAKEEQLGLGLEEHLFAIVLG